jgi:hypothetical protein
MVMLRTLSIYILCFSPLLHGQKAELEFCPECRTVFTLALV